MAKKITPEERAKILNSELNHISSVLPGGSAKIANQLDPILMKLSGKTTIRKGEDNDYFSVDNSYDGNVNNLIHHVTFKKIPEDSEVQKYVKNINKDPHATPASYAKFVDDWHSKAYKTLTRRLNMKKPNPEKTPVYYDSTGERLSSLKNVEMLEQIMNSSAAWHIAKRSAYDSDQTLERWHELYEAVESAFNANETLFDWVFTQIQNEQKSLNQIINAVDDEISKMMAGKYSKRLGIQY